MGTFGILGDQRSSTDLAILRRRCHLESTSVIEFLKARFPNAKVIFADQLTASSTDAASAIRTQIEKIAKSIVFASDNMTAVVVISGAKRVSRSKLRSHQKDHSLKIASPEVVLQRTGYVVGGVSPLLLPEGVEVLVDSSLLDFEAVWISAGSPYAVVELSKSQLMELFVGRFGQFDEAVDAEQCCSVDYQAPEKVHNQF